MAELTPHERAVRVVAMFCGHWDSEVRARFADAIHREMVAALEVERPPVDTSAPLMPVASPTRTAIRVWTPHTRSWWFVSLLPEDGAEGARMANGAKP